MDVVFKAAVVMTWLAILLGYVLLEHQRQAEARKMIKARLATLNDL